MKLKLAKPPAGVGILALLLLVFTGMPMSLAANPTGDRDGDGIVDTVDQDDDNDGIADRFELGLDGSDRDSDLDGVPNRLDLDSDNDGLPDLYESGFFISLPAGNVRVVNGRFLDEVGDNGLVDVIETSPDSGFVAFSLVNSDESDGDIVPDFLDLDSDNDGILDLVEAGVSEELDSNRDGRLDADPGNVGNDGILDLAQLNNDQNCCDYNFDGIQDQIPRNTDGGDLPDFQDLDSDNDGINDLIEAGGSDVDLDGRIDDFFDDANEPDGVDDQLFIVPLALPDNNGDGVPDYIDFATAIVPAAPVPDPPVEEETPVPEQPGIIEADNEPEITSPPITIVEDTVEEPPLDVALDDSVASVTNFGEIETGLSGGVGCSIASFGSGANAAASRQFDTGLSLLLLMAILSLIAKSVSRRANTEEPGNRRRPMKAVTTASSGDSIALVR